MNKTLFSLASLTVVIVLVLSLGAGSIQAQASPPAGIQAPQVALGQPGTSFRYAGTLGVAGEPYLTDTLHLYRPMGISVDTDTLYTVEEYGQRLLGYNATGTNTLSTGHAGIATHSDGYLNTPADVTTDSSHNLWVVMDHAIKAFDPAGNQLLVYPNDSWQDGKDNAHFIHPLGIAFDHTGRLFISDFYNHRIQVYSVSGTTLTYVNTIGVTGTPGSDNTHFNLPGRIAFDSKNALYVTDVPNYRIQKCTSANNWAAWSCTTFFGGTEGSNPASGQMSGSSFGIGVGGADDVFIADGANYRVLKCTPAGVCAHFVGTVGAPGSDNAHFAWPSDVAVDSTGTVYVADPNNMRIQVFAPAGTYLRSIGTTGIPYNVDAVRYNQPWGIAAASSGGLYIYENNGKRLIKVNPDGSQAWTAGQAGVTGSGNGTFGINGFGGDSGNPAETQDGKVYMPDNGNHRIQTFSAATGDYLSTFGQYGQGNNQFNGPSGVSINPSNQDILVSDQMNHRVQIFTKSWAYKATIGVTGQVGADSTHFNRPKSTAVDSSGAVYVADSDNLRVQKCTTANGTAYTCTTFVGAPGGTNGSLEENHPVSLALDKSGRLYVVSDWYNKVQVYNPSGAYLTSIGGSWGSRSGELNYPEGVAVDKNDAVLVTDMWNHRVQKFVLGVPGWLQANINGFGNPAAVSVVLAEFNGQLYGGANDFTNGAQIWRTSDGRTWNPVTTRGAGIGAGKMAIMDMIEFGGKLYAGTGWGGTPPNTHTELWRAADGIDWAPVMTGGFGNPDGTAVDALGVFGGQLYAAVSDDSWDGGAAIYRSGSGDAGTWLPVVNHGNGDVNNFLVDDFAVFNGRMYAVGKNPVAGAFVWQSSADGSAWTQVNPPGFDSTHQSEAISIAVFNDRLYVATYNSADVLAQVWQSENGTTWTKSGSDGFGNPNNFKFDALYVSNGFLFAVNENPQSGCEIWKTSDGSTWERVMTGGFGSSSNFWTLRGHAILNFKDSLYVGIGNSVNGIQIWQMLGRSLYVPVIKK